MDLITVSHIGCTYVALDLNRHPAAACPLTPVQVQVGWLISFCQYVGPTWIHHHSWIKIMPIGLSLTFFILKITDRTSHLSDIPEIPRALGLGASNCKPGPDLFFVFLIHPPAFLCLICCIVLRGLSAKRSQGSKSTKLRNKSSVVGSNIEQQNKAGILYSVFSWGTSCQALPLVGHVAACGLAPDQGWVKWQKNLASSILRIPESGKAGTFKYIMASGFSAATVSWEDRIWAHIGKLWNTCWLGAVMAQEKNLIAFCGH